MKSEINAVCPECGRTSPGHSISCKTGNERARKYQAGLAKREFKVHGKKAADWSKRRSAMLARHRAELDLLDAELNEILKEGS